MNYSDKYIDLAMERLLGLKRRKTVMWSIKPPFMQDVRTVFNHSVKERKEFFDIFYPYVGHSDSILDKAKKIAEVVNNHMSYETDYRTFGRAERWERAIDAWHRGKGDCESYAVIINEVLDIFGAHPWENWVWAGYAKRDDGTFEGHATAMVFDMETQSYYAVEGSFYPRRAMKNLGKVPLGQNEMYTNNLFFIANRYVSYTDTPWFMKLVPLTN